VHEETVHEEMVHEETVHEETVHEETVGPRKIDRSRYGLPDQQQRLGSERGPTALTWREVQGASLRRDSRGGSQGPFPNPVGPQIGYRRC